MKSIVNIKYRNLVLGISIAIGLQIFSLFRNFKDIPKCGKIVEPFKGVNVLINCDSAIFMKDADNPIRLFDGTSDYQDRPAHSFIISIILKLFRFLNLPDKTFPVSGLSGSQYNYSASSYVLFIGFNLCVLMLAVYLTVKIFEQINSNPLLISKNLVKVIPLAVGMLSANELTKTFFWTPHSQMFNLLLPVAALRLVYKVKDFNLQKFLFANLGILVVIFFYPSFAILMAILVFAPVLNFFLRVCICGAFLLPYAVYPIAINFFGGQYRNTAVLKFREFIWVWDALKDGSFPHAVTQNAKSFLLTFPIIPSLLILSVFALVGFINKEFNKVNLKRALTSPFSAFIVTYVSYLYFLGFYSRRLTLGLIVFLAVTLLLYMMKKTPLKLERFTPYIAIILGLFIFSSWFFTNGPLV